MIETGKNISSIYFLITFFVGVFVVLNVFTAVLIANYTALDFVRGRREHVGREEKFQYGKAVLIRIDPSICMVLPYLSFLLRQIGRRGRKSVC